VGSNLNASEIRSSASEFGHHSIANYAFDFHFRGRLLVDRDSEKPFGESNQKHGK